MATTECESIVDETEQLWIDTESGIQTKTELIEEDDEEGEEIVSNCKKKNFLSLKDKAEILQRLEHGAMGSQLAREYGISKTTVSRFKKRKDVIKKAVTTIYPNNTERRTMHGGFYKKMEDALYQWYLEQKRQHSDVTGPMLRQKAKTLYNECEDSNDTFAASFGWFSKFKRRYGIKLSNKSAIAVQQTTLEATEIVATDPLNIGHHQAIRPIAQKSSQNVDPKEAIRSIDKVIQWSTENNVDTLYLTMLRSLKNQIKLSPKVRHILK